ncbi:F-box/kelch-repeat protein At3g23880-like [Silene latifolia]|uniref:F-box/kelch-repeat protein At3g23880-like n=1 Tax=Silene latifolia TaxID=37657 RepID=UPI003D76B23B
MSAMKKPKLTSGNTNDQHKLVPEHLILDNILPRLPVKSLLRFKPVCKSWFASISTPAFQKSHLRFSSSALKFLLFHGQDHIDDERKIFLLSYDESKTIGSDLVQLDCNCLSEESDYFFTSSLQASGFGYVSSTDDYKIFAMDLSSPIDGFAYLFLFSLNTGTWRRLNYLDGTYYGRSLSGGCAVYMGDTLYWPFRNQNSRAVVGIVCFNLVHEQMNKVQNFPWLCNYNIFKMKGCLSLCCSKGRNLDSDIWMLKQQGGCSLLIAK